ncbi:MAG: CAAX protease self-immunity [candidate division Zixibacteria bacterium RBG-1]|nr:MAG: CAAX protease self-immunity [candidate division Zixibacteria bacterium RBG-1]
MIAKKYSLILFFLLAYFISWVIWAPLWLPYFNITSLPVLPFHHAFGSIGPLLAAFIILWFEKGKSGVKQLVGRMFRWRVKPVWYAIALVGPFLLFGIALLINYFLTGEFRYQGIGVSKEFPQFGFLAFLAYNIATFGYGEETGWRGYALPKLQNRFKALWASMILTVGWALWHVPLFLYRPGYTEMGFQDILGWFISLLVGSILLTWLFNSTRGSILIAALFHATIDIAFTSDITNIQIVNYMGMLITVFGVAVLVMFKPKNLSIFERQKT